MAVTPPWRMDRKLPQVTFWAVLAEEADPPQGEDPVRWLLLTSMPVTTFEEAMRVLALYQRRWDIEVFHRVLKTGCRVEHIQLREGPAGPGSIWQGLSRIRDFACAWHAFHES